MRVFLLLGLTLKRSGGGLEDRLFLRIEYIPQRAFTCAVPILQELHAGDPQDQHQCTEYFEWFCGHGVVFDAETFALYGPENLSNDPAPTVELRDPSRLFERFNWELHIQLTILLTVSLRFRTF